MRRLVLGLALALVVAAPAGAYEHLSQHAAVSGVQPDHWQTLPIHLTLDGGPTDLTAEIATAIGTWNAVPTARDPFDPVVTKSAVDFDETNLGTDWGRLTGDGQQEVVVDETGRALTALGLAPEAVNGFGPQHELVSGGQALIDDMFLIVNASKVDFDRRSTEVHELGHTIGIAHSSVGFPVGTDGALSPQLESQVPTMHPFAVPGTSRRTLEADDVAALSDLYPGPTFASTDGTITGRVTRCSDDLPVLGANVRAINVNDPSVQLSRVSGFDGGPEGTYTIRGVPPGDYFVVVEPLAGDDEFVSRLATYTNVDVDFEQEYFNASKEGDCDQDTDPAARESVAVGAGASRTADLKVSSATLALVVDVTRSMGPEIGAVKTGLEAMIGALDLAPGAFPEVAIVTFDDHANVNLVSRDPDRLIDEIAGLTTHGTPDCPEGSNAAVMTAGRLLGAGGRAVLITDADALRSGPSHAAVDALYASKGAQLNTMLSGSCPPEQNPPAQARIRARAAGGTAGANPDEAKPVDALGVETSIRTFGEESLFTGGLFSFQPGVKSGGAAALERYSDTLANLGISAVRPTVAAADPAAVPQGATLDVELTGAGTGFRSPSTVAVSGTGVTATAVDVTSPTSMIVRLTVAPDAATGFRDVTVGTDRGDGSVETAKGLGAVQVVGPPAGPTVLSVTPSAVAAGARRDVTISGALTHFAAATSVAGFGEGVTVNGLVVKSPTSAVADVTVAPGAKVDFRDVTVKTGAETAAETVPGPFLVVAASPAVARLLAASPRSGARGSTVDVTLTGAGTAFEAGTSVASISGSGVRTLSTTVNTPTSAVLRLEIAAGAPLGFRDVEVTTGAQHAAVLDGFEITPAFAGPPTPTPSPGAGGGSPGGGGQPATCTDRAAPRATIARVRAQRRRLHLRGRASDTGCAAAIPVAGRVARVEVAIARAVRRRTCRFVARSGRLTAARTCSKPVWLIAKGTGTWRLDTARPLPRGSYTVRVRARDSAGNLQRTPALRTVRVR